MGLFDRWKQLGTVSLPTESGGLGPEQVGVGPAGAAPVGAAPAGAGRVGAGPARYRLGEEQRAGELQVALLAITDPFESSVNNGHCSEEYELGLERLLSFDVRIRNASASTTLSVSAGKFHLFDDADYLTEPLGLDSRVRKPNLVETFLPPGAAVRGWVTFCLGWDRQPARLQFFTGYLSAQVAVFGLPCLDAESHARRRDAYRQQRADADVVQQLDAREREIAALEARSLAAQAARAHEGRARELAVREEKARQLLVSLQERDPLSEPEDASEDD